MVIQGIKGTNCNREFKEKNSLISNKSWVTWGWCVCVLSSLGICRIWLDITCLEQPGATCPVHQSVFSSPHESGYPVPNLHKEIKQLLTASSPLSGGPVPPSTVGSRVWKGHNLQGLPGLSGPSCLYLVAPLFHFHVSLCPQALL